MPLFAFYCRDGEHGAKLRERLLADHLAHVEAHLDDYAVAGPLKKGDDTIGSLLVIKAADEDEARAKFEVDPYFHAGVWQSISASAFMGVAGEWVGGAAWKR
ncbi:YciI family protein [Erythrobacter sp. WH131]|uniref:YciI family protein n=2 Tax=Erythrobacter ani TaxID=2827235 RepID=A0ABS6SJN1_9SPHN|nr:YciI family protein [Erythrobacter ani]